MVLLDASVLIDYLAGDDPVISFLESHVADSLSTIRLVAFEVYQGEVFKPTPADFDELDDRLRWLTVRSVPAETPRVAAELQVDLQQNGATLAPRDAYIAGAAIAMNEPLAYRDEDFDIDALDGKLERVRV